MTEYVLEDPAALAAPPRRPSAAEFLAAARVPATLLPQHFAPWTIERVEVARLVDILRVGAYSMTLLWRYSRTTPRHHEKGDVVMEDSIQELRRHLPIWLIARGRVLVTGLGLGCVVRGLLANPFVTHVDVVEIDPAILRIVGAEFAGNPRVTLHEGDALTYSFHPGTTWDFAWHDLWTDGPRCLSLLHMDLLQRFDKLVPRQGAWGWPRNFKGRLRDSYEGLIP